MFKRHKKTILQHMLVYAHFFQCITVRVVDFLSFSLVHRQVGVKNLLVQTPSCFAQN